MPPPPRMEQTRSTTTRSATARRAPQAGYRGKLYIPPDWKKDGYTYRWIRAYRHNSNEADESNIQSRMIDGWLPVKTDEMVQMQLPELPGVMKTSSGLVRVGDSILFKRPTADCDAEADAYRQQTEANVKSVAWDNKGVNEDARMPFTDLGSGVAAERVVTERIVPFGDKYK